MNFKKLCSSLRCLCFWLAMILLTACGKEDKEDNVLRIAPTVTAQEKLSGVHRAGTVFANGVLYYSDAYSGEEKTEITVYRKREGQEAEALTSFPLSDYWLFHYFGDENGAVCYVYCQAKKEGEKIRFQAYLNRDDSTGSKIYSTLLGEETVPAPAEGESVWAVFPESLDKWNGISAGTSDGEGRVCLYSGRGDFLYLFDAGGNLVKEVRCPPVEKGGGEGQAGGPFDGSEEGLFRAGADCYFYSLGQTKTAIRKVDFAAGSLAAWEELPFQPADVIFLSGESGEEGGILVSTGGTLYLYRLPAGAEEVACGL